jgi:hypothetical protein
MRHALLAAALVLLLSLPQATARACSGNTCSVSLTWDAQQRAPSSVSVDCTPQTLQQTTGLLVHPAVLSGGLSRRETDVVARPGQLSA